MSRRAEIGLGLQSDKAPGDYARLAAAAEDYGVDVLSVYGDLLYQPPLAPLLEMAASTSSVRLGAACWNPYTTHPYELAGQLAALERASGGRAYLGMAKGAWLGALGVRQPRPVGHLREAIALIRALLSGSTEGLPGPLFPLAAGTTLRYARPTVLPRVLIGTWGATTAALAGEVADEVKVGGSANPAMVPVMRQRTAVGARRVGRAEDAVGIVVGAVTVVDEDGDVARALARTEVAMYLPVIAGLDPTVTLPELLLEAVSARLAAGDNPGAGRLIPDDVLDLFAFSGTPERVAQQAQAVIDAGAARVEFGTPHGLTGDIGVGLIGSRVLPLLRREASG